VAGAVNKTVRDSRYDVRAHHPNRDVPRQSVNFKDLLNTDHEAIIQWLLHAFRWWVDELMGMVPPEWRDRLLTRSSAVAEFHDKGIVYRDAVSGETLAEKPKHSVKVILAPADVLMREIDLPILPMSDLKRMVALDLDRLTPFRPDQVLFDTEVIARDEANARQQIMLGVMTRRAIAEVMERAQANDLDPAGIGVALPSGEPSNLDFLPALREAQGGTAARRRATYWWIAAGVLMAFNLFMLSYRDSSALDQLRQAVESQQAPVTVAMRLRDKVTKEAAHRTELLKLQQQNAPLPVIAAITEALPNDAWVERLEWNGRTVHVRGFRKDSPNLLAKIEASPLLRNARSLTPDTRTALNGTFDLAADREVERIR
jgi:general secretion pathway protein L